MKTFRSIALSLACLPLLVAAQTRYMTRTGEISFFSHTTAEDIDAVNHKVTSVFDVTTGQIEFSLLQKAFEFKKALMQDHYNENYVESNTYPKATFKGKVIGFTAADLAKPGTKEVTVEGDLEMHGVVQHRTFKATITVEPTGAVKASADFIVKPEDHKITIPSVVRSQISEDIQVKVRIDYQKM